MTGSPVIFFIANMFMGIEDYGKIYPLRGSECF